MQRALSSLVPRKAVVTAALNGVLTDPKLFSIPVTPVRRLGFGRRRIIINNNNNCIQREMAVAAKEAYDAGASVVHTHLRDQRPGMGHLPSWCVVFTMMMMIVAQTNSSSAILLLITKGMLILRAMSWQRYGASAPCSST